MEPPPCFPRLAKIPGLKMIALSSLGSVRLRMLYLPCPFPRHHCGDPAVILLTLVTEVSRTYPLQLLVQIRGTLMAPGARAVGGSMASTLKLGQTPEEGVPLPNELPGTPGTPEFREMGGSAALLYHEFYLRGEWLYYMLCP